MQERGNRKEERGKRTVEKGKRKGEKGKRKEEKFTKKYRTAGHLGFWNLDRLLPIQPATFLEEMPPLNLPLNCIIASRSLQAAS